MFMQYFLAYINAKYSSYVLLKQREEEKRNPNVASLTISCKRNPTRRIRRRRRTKTKENHKRKNLTNNCNVNFLLLLEKKITLSFTLNNI